MYFNRERLAARQESLERERDHLRKKEDRLLKREDRLRDDKDQLRAETNARKRKADELEESQFIKLNIIAQKQASVFTASGTETIKNCGCNGIFKSSFNLPPIVKNAIELELR